MSNIGYSVALRLNLTVGGGFCKMQIQANRGEGACQSEHIKFFDWAPSP